MTFLGIDEGRVALFGDWHGNRKWAAEAIKRATAAGATVGVHLGDFGVWRGWKGREFLDVVNEACAEHGMELGFVDGNHENFDLLYASPIGPDGLRELRGHVRHIPRGTRWVWSGLTWLGLGGACSLDRPRRIVGYDWWPDEELTCADVMKATDPGVADVMVTHDAPITVDVPGIGKIPWPVEELYRTNQHRKLMADVVAIVHPRYFFHGHFHVRYGMEVDGTKYVGLNCDGSTFADNQLIIDTDDPIFQLPRALPTPGDAA